MLCFGHWEKALVGASSVITNLRVYLRFKLYLWPGAVHQHSPAPTSEVGVVDPAAPGSVVLAAPARRQAPAGEGEAPDVVPAAPAAGFYRYDKRRCLSVLDREPPTAAAVG